jgi:predicted dithiol-disulfide oxidoreductase (DUF899 family)
MTMPKQSALQITQPSSGPSLRIVPAPAADSGTVQRRASQPLYEGPDGPVPLLDLMDGHAHLVLYHFKLTPGGAGAPRGGCPGCTRYIDNIDRAALDQLAERDASFALASRAPIESLQAFKKRMSWKHAWVSSAGEIAPPLPESEHHGISIFTREGNEIRRKYLAMGQAMENLGPLWTLLDLPAAR